jgi:hypothetical protein
MSHQRASVSRCSRVATASALVAAAFMAHHVVAQVTMTNPAAVTKSQSSQTSQDIRDIRGPKPIRSVWLIPLIAMTALLSSASVYATWTWYRQRKRQRLETPYDIALHRLERVRALMQPESGRTFSIELSSVVREYIESRFGVMAAHLTTDEFLHDSLASRDAVLAANRDLLADFMASCDLAKFGGWNLSNPMMETMWHSARRFIVDSAAATVPSHTTISPGTAIPGAANVRSVGPRETYDSVPST